MRTAIRLDQRIVFRAWLILLSLVIAAGIIAGFLVFKDGLILTNLSDLVPWGLWITLDLSAIALSAGAFSLCAAVYLLGLKRFQPVARTATYIGLIGYSMAMLCLLLDIGRPDRFWHGFVFWNVHSVLWEVTMCVGLYFGVLVLEVTPIVAKADLVRNRWPRLSAGLGKLHHVAPWLAIAGLVLSMLHQSSLGATYGVLKARPSWYQPGLPVLFMMSAIIGGISLTLLASLVASALSARRARVKQDLIEPLASFVGWLLVAYLYMRFWDLLSATYGYEAGRTEGLRLLTKGRLAPNFWFGEILLGTIVPMIILLKPRWRASGWRLGLALLLVVGGLVAYRWDINLLGQLVVVSYLEQAPGVLFAAYTPALIEWVAAAGIVAYGLLAFTLGVRYLDVVDHTSGKPVAQVVASSEEPLPALGT